ETFARSTASAERVAKVDDRVELRHHRHGGCHEEQAPLKYPAQTVESHHRQAAADEPHGARVRRVGDGHLKGDVGAELRGNTVAGRGVAVEAFPDHPDFARVGIADGSTGIDQKSAQSEAVQEVEALAPRARGTEI